MYEASLTESITKSFTFELNFMALRNMFEVVNKASVCLNASLSNSSASRNIDSMDFTFFTFQGRTSLLNLDAA